MNQQDFLGFVEQNINSAAQRIVDKGVTSDEIAFGKLSFYLALRRELNSQRTPQDLGMLGAINDTLQELGVLTPDRTFLSYL